MFFGKDRRTREHGFLKDMRTREHEKKGKGLLEQNENKRFGWALPNTPFLRYPHLTIGFFTLHFSLNIWIFHSSLFTLHLTSPLLVVSTERTEAYGIKVLESTERIDAARHTTEGTELIACVASPRLSMVAVYGGARLLYLYLLACTQSSKQSFLWILASRSVGHSVDSKSLSP